MTLAAGEAGSVSGLAAPAPTRPSADWFAHEVAFILTAALARDDAKLRRRCPRCGRRLDDGCQ